MRLRSDDQLVALFRMGHEDAFGTIHDRYRQRLFAYTRQMLAGSRADAEDALQDVFVRAYGALRADDRPVTLRAWLYRVAHNRCVDQLRRPVPAPAEVLDAVRAPLQDPLAECERREDLRRLVADVRRLPAQQRSALLMRELEGLGYREISEAMLVSIPAVKSLLVRARMGLAEATEARDTACAEIREDLAGSHERGVRASARARRHMHECVACRDYRTGLRGTRQGLAALSPGSGPLSSLAKLLGVGAGGSGAAAGGGAAIGGGAATVTATKVAAIVCCAALAGGAAEVQQIAGSPAAKHAGHARTRAATAGTGASLGSAAAPAEAIDSAIARRAQPQPSARDVRQTGAPQAAGRAADPSTAAPAPSVDAPVTADPQTGGALAPDEPAPPDGTTTATAPAGGNGDTTPPPDTTTPPANGTTAASQAPPSATATSATAPTGISPSPSTPPSQPSSTSKS